MNVSRWDRHLPIVRNLTGADQDAVLRKFLGERILLTGSGRSLSSDRGRLMLCTAANLVARFCPRIDLALPAEHKGLAVETLALLRSIDGSGHAEFRVVECPNYSSYAAMLSIGMSDASAKGATTIEARGWVSIISGRGSLPHVTDSDERNPFGALAAAALGASEVFKHLVQPLPGKAFHLGDATFSTYDYSVNGSDPGPALPTVIQLPATLLAGAGAVGNAVLCALANLPKLEGSLYVVDQGALDDPSNFNRYVLTVEGDVVPENPVPKVELARRLFANRGLRIEPFREPFATFLPRIHSGEVSRPEIVISAVDNNDARQELQKLWPSLLLEGATGETTSQVSRHHYEHGLACLMCIHTDSAQSRDNFSYLAHASRESGLRKDRIAAGLQNATARLLVEDIQNAPSEKRGFLVQRVGQPLCSVLSEVEHLSSRPAEDLPIQPSVSFVSMTSGVLAAAELVKHVAKLATPLETLFQMDSMFPLSSAMLQPVEKVPSCYCSLRSAEIRRYRDTMR